MAQGYSYLDTSFDQAEPLSVSQALGIAKRALESVTLSIVGEVSDVSDNPRYKAVYFTLADEGAALPCLMWRSSFDTLGVQLKSGMQIEVRGRFSVYSAKGRMQFDVRRLTLAGEGQLRAQVAALAAKLRAQGLMEPSQKLALPILPQTIAVVTSPSGKAIHDVLRTLKRRFALARVLFFGVTVEGKGAVPALMQALAAAQDSSAELILLVRGGGSYEDLMPFNDEGLAHAIAASSKPVITGIGHEPDTSIADMVASLRASTPTAAAEAAVPSTEELLSFLKAKKALLNRGLTRMLERQRHEVYTLERVGVLGQGANLTQERALNLEQTAQRLDRAIPLGFETAKVSLETNARALSLAKDTLLRHYRAALTQTENTMMVLGKGMVTVHEAFLGAAAASLESLSPLSVIARGYALVYDQDGYILRSASEVEKNDEIKVQLAEGSITATIVDRQLYISNNVRSFDG